MVNQGSSLVAIRLVRDEDLEKDWATLPVESYLPMFLNGENNEANIAKRLDLIYFRKDKTIRKICWNLRGETKGVVLDSPYSSKS